MSIEQEFFNQLFPIGNTVGMRAMTAVAVPSGVGGVVDLSTVFGPTGAGGYYTAKADNVPSGHAIYIAAHTQPTYGLRPDAVAGGTGMGSNPTGMCWPLLNGQEVRGRLPSWGIDTFPTGASMGYGATAGYRATLTAPNYLHFRGSAGIPTGAVLRIMRSSVPWAGTVGDFLKPPV